MRQDVLAWGGGVQVSMREVSDKCQGAVCRIWDKCGGWAWCEGIGKGTRFDSRDWDFERSDQDTAPVSDKGPRRREEGVGDGMGTWNVTTKCRQGGVGARAAGVEMISDKCGGWAWCEGIGKGIDLTVGDWNAATKRRFRTRVQGGGRRASVIGMGTWNVRRGRAGRLSLEKFQTSARER